MYILLGSFNVRCTMSDVRCTMLDVPCYLSANKPFSRFFLSEFYTHESNE